jgi:hypothetical protein
MKIDILIPENPLDMKISDSETGQVLDILDSITGLEIHARPGELTEVTLNMRCRAVHQVGREPRIFLVGIGYIKSVILEDGDVLSYEHLLGRV